MMNLNGSTTRPCLGWVRYAGWGLAAALVLLPAAAMRVAPDSGVKWTGSDFLLAAVLLGSVGLLLELTVRTSTSLWRRLGALTAIGTGFLLIWSNLAVGYIGNGDSPINLAFLAIPLAAFIGGAAVRFGNAAMAAVLLAAGVAHAVAGAIGYAEDPRTGLVSLVFVGLWLSSALLFRMAERNQ